MKTKFSIFLMLIPLNFLVSQVGLNIHYHNSDYTGWNEVLKDIPDESPMLFSQSYSIGVDYGFSLRWYRVSFFPELFYKRSNYELDWASGFDYYSYYFDLIQYGLSFNTLVYPLDLLSKKSMECPSFYRGMDKFTKGWFISFDPALFLSDKEMEYYGGPFIDPGPVRDRRMVFSFGLGTGIDIGITENFAVTPSIRYAFTVGEKWDGFSGAFNQPSFNDGTSVSYWSAGLRIGLWF